jgi:predicted porin
MKKSLIAMALTGAFAVPAFAQNSVTLYGIIDAGIDYVNNSGGHALWQAQSGITQGSRFGFMGTEDLGGGTSAIFKLENGFNTFSGKLGQGGLMFGRQAYVGLTNNAFGTLTLGRQYDTLVDLVQATTFNGQWGAFFSHPSDIDNSDNGFRVNNTVKYVTPRWSGLSAEAMYAFGGQAGEFGANSTIAVGASYANGPVYVGAAYFFAKNPSTQFVDGNWQKSTPVTPDVSTDGAFGFVGTPSSMQTFGGGGTYSIGQAVIGADIINVRYDDANGFIGNTVTFTSYEIWANYHLTPAATLGLGYTFTDGKVDVGDAKPKYNQVNLMADYLLSKRTDVYIMAVYQHASGGALADIYQGAAAAQSSTDNQVLARVGIRTKF